MLCGYFLLLEGGSEDPSSKLNWQDWDIKNKKHTQQQQKKFKPVKIPETFKILEASPWADTSNSNNPWRGGSFLKLPKYVQEAPGIQLSWVVTQAGVGFAANTTAFEWPMLL